ncbi:MAG: histone deacetylase family protein [Spirochaetales bacterium]|nr:histone deacetylase family protein [Spirochaetales bacterium]
MKIVHGDVHVLHSPQREFDGETATLGPHPEVPARAEMILAALRAGGFGPVVAPRPPLPEELGAAHTAELLGFLEEFCARGPVPGRSPSPEGGGSPGWEEAAADAFALRGWQIATRPRSLAARFGLYCFDPQTPLQPGTWRAARAAAGCALTGADLLAAGERAAYALCRPPGHHAGRGFFGGYCYLNNAALAARRLSGGPSAPRRGRGQPGGPSAPRRGPGGGRGGTRVAVLDLDFHHGNGTQEIFYRDAEVLYVSLHADPNEAYPYFSGYRDERGEGPGEGANLNFPLPGRCGESAYRETLAEALEGVGSFAPAYLVVSLGTDILSQDPVGGMGMSVSGFGRLGEAVRALGLPTLVVQEGGYAVEAIGACVAEFLGAWG